MKFFTPRSQLFWQGEVPIMKLWLFEFHDMKGPSTSNILYLYLYWSYICQRSKGHVDPYDDGEGWNLPNSMGTQRTSILDLDSGTWVRNVIFSRLDDNLVGRSVDHPRCCRRWSVGHLWCCEDGGNLRFSRQAAEVLAWLRERTFTGEKLLGTRSLPCSSVLRQNASLWSALLLKFHPQHCRVEGGRKGPDRKLWLVLVFLHQVYETSIHQDIIFHHNICIRIHWPACIGVS